MNFFKTCNKDIERHHYCNKQGFGYVSTTWTRRAIALKDLQINNASIQITRLFSDEMDSRNQKLLQQPIEKKICSLVA